MTDSAPVVLITGASRGMGRALALRHAARGSTVVINYRRDDDAAAAAVAEIERVGGKALAIAADVADLGALEDMMTQVGNRFGHLDVVVANAAASAFKPLADIRAHHIERTMAISVGGFLDLVRLSTPLMPSGGRIVAVSGWDSFRVLPGHGLLGAAKAALEALVRYLAVELADRGISTVGVCPGPVDTDSFRFYAGDAWEEFQEHWLKQLPTRAFPGPDDMAEAIDVFTQPSTRWINGQTIVIDGGMSIATMPMDLKGSLGVHRAR